MVALSASISAMSLLDSEVFALRFSFGRIQQLSVLRYRIYFDVFSHGPVSSLLLGKAPLQ